MERILKFKSTSSPDPKNQLGFSKGAQTNDHILTLSTIVSKYKKLKTPVYAVFVDFKKAFDSVCREALFLKLAKLGITGKIFKTLQHMYQNSTGQIKISGHLSNKFDIRKGTEQGHPLSPDLFKIYIKDLSSELDHEDCPKLLDQIISHLLWADDLILLATSPSTLQKQLDSLQNYCTDWGVEINIDKTKLMTFNSQFSPSRSHSFHIGTQVIKKVDTYCYLGIDIHESGLFSNARCSLKKKAMRALYGLKSTINKSKISFRSLTTLFDSLIKPIVLYGAPILTPSMPIIKHLTKIINTPAKPPILSNSKLLNKFSLLNSEKVHLHFLKWALGVNRKATNAGVWGESGRYPLVFESINLTLKYINRIKNLKDTNSLLALAFKEQRELKLDWYKSIEPILKLDACFSADHVTAHNIMKHSQTNSRDPDLFLIHKGVRKLVPPQKKKPQQCNIFKPHIIMKNLKLKFRDLWKLNIGSSSKLEYYRKYKNAFEKEPYLDMVENFSDRNNLTRLRISAHHLEIERGRYNNITRCDRICKWCNIALGSNIVENENHFVNECDLYATKRRQLKTKISNIFIDSCHTTVQIHDIIDLTHDKNTNYSKLVPEEQKQLVRIVARFIKNSFKHRDLFLKC